MKKRILALACAVTMMFGMSFSVFAAGSSTPSAKAEEAASSYDASQDEPLTTANSIGQAISAANISYYGRATKITSGVSGAEILPVSLDVAKTMIAEANKRISGAFIASIVDLNVPAGTGTATFTIECPDIWQGQSVTIVHMKSDGTFENIKPSKVADNSVTFTMTSYSPIAVVVGPAPKTADKGILAWLLSLF